MKRFAYSLFAAALVALSGCQDDALVEEQVAQPAQTGDEITFGSALTDVQLRTIYGDDPVNGAYPVYWEDGDQVAIYCPDAAQTKMVEYKVTPDENDSTHSATVTKINPEEAGLQWGAGETHHFSAFYPADKVDGIDNGKLKCSIPVEQTPVYWKETPNGTGTTYTGVANTDYAFMWAYGTHDKSQGGDVALNFKPWVTILDVEINGPETAGDEVKMSSVQLTSLSGDVLNGEFTLDFTAVEQNPDNRDLYPTYEDAGRVTGTRSYITIQFYDKEKEDYITLKHGDKIVVRFYLLPKDVNYDTSGEGRNDLQIRVTPFNSGVLTRTLNAQGGSQTGGILAHKVNKVILPPVERGGTNYWMSSLDPTVYVTELSLPGSKMSYQTSENGASVAYQTLSIADQFKNGVRAFQFQTASERESSGGSSLNPWDENEIDLHLVQTVAGNATGTEFKTVVSEIAAQLKAAEQAAQQSNRINNEYAFILLTVSEGACQDYVYRTPIEDPGWEDILYPYDNHTVNAKQAWMDAIKEDFAEMVADEETYRLYTSEITSSTTIGDVKGHIIVKVNYNDDEYANRLSDTDRIPAMFSQWGIRDDVTLDFTETDAYAVNAMRWGTSNNVDTGNLQWFYHEATSVGYENDDAGDYGETEDLKKQNIKDMWERSVTYYKGNNDHSMWFLNDLGGSYVNGDRYSDGESQSGVNDWTAEVGPYATSLLQNRDADATLGIVLINQISADPTSYSSNLVQTIINNNFSFILRTAGQTTQQYNATYNNGGNAIGWDNQ